MPRYTFDEVAITAKKSWKDSETGKTRQATKKFYQTLNPFNQNADGTIKTREQIVAQLVVERDAWLAAPGETK